jgi:hypothetical protein
MKYEPKSSLQDINDYGHFLNRGAWMTASGYGRKFLSDLQHCESCLAEAEREVERLKSLMQQVRREIHEQGHVSSGSWASMLHVEGLLNSEWRAGE